MYEASSGDDSGVGIKVCAVATRCREIVFLAVHEIQYTEGNGKKWQEMARHEHG